MSSPTLNYQQVRRSSRQSVPSRRGKQYIDERNQTTSLYPSVGDDINVKWLLRHQVVWWRATVLAIEAGKSGDLRRSGKLLYHKHDEYEPVESAVVFSISKSHTPQRFVATTDSLSTSQVPEPCSWLFSDELGSDEEESGDMAREEVGQDVTKTASGSDSTIINYRPVVKRPESSRRLSLRSRTILRNGLETKILKRTINNQPPNSKAVKKLEPQLIAVEPSKTGASRGTPGSSTPTLLDTIDIKVEGSELDEAVERGETGHARELKLQADDEGNFKDAEHDRHSFDIRLRLIERQLEDVRKASSSNLSATANSVIVSLKWALLRSLEKPLRNLALEGLAQDGVAASEIVISSNCDYYTFRELAAVLYKEHQCHDAGSGSRIAFSPSFNTTQSGSGASDNMNILFSCLADLTSFLLIRDDNDFESILIKEVVTDSSTLLRILGSFNVEGQGDELLMDGQSEHRSGSSSTNVTQSISATSDKPSIISVFDGSSTVNYKQQTREGGKQHKREVSNSQGDINAPQSNFRYTLLQQEQRYFCPTQKCYRAPWHIKPIESNFAVNCFFHLDGTVSKEHMKKFFLLTWTRSPSPSTTKWTRDIDNVGNNLPGSLRLSIPYMFFTSNRNVRSVVSLLDAQIETFMTLKSKLHNRSSFK